MSLDHTNMRCSGLRVNARLVLVGAIVGAICSAAVIAAVVCAGMYLARQRSREAGAAARLYNIAYAMRYAYYDIHDHFPPAHIVDDDGRPAHSWRALLLPVIEEHELARAYRLDEPWNGPNNSLLRERAPRLFRARDDWYRPHEWTDVVAFLGPHGVLSEEERVTHASLAGRRENLIMLVHIPPGIVRWLEPRDLPFPAANQSTASDARDTPFITLPSDPIVLFADKQYFKIRRDVDFAALGDWTRDGLIRLGIVYPLPQFSWLLSPATGRMLIALAMVCVVCIVVAFLARRALRKARGNGSECSVP